MEQQAKLISIAKWIISHTLVLLIMVLFAALKGVAFWGYTILLVALMIFLVLYMPVIGLLQSAFHTRKVLLSQLEKFLLNAIWIGFASFVFLLIFKSETRSVFLIIAHVLTLSLFLSPINR